jgi:hypothetical protein
MAQGGRKPELTGCGSAPGERQIWRFQRRAAQSQPAVTLLPESVRERPSHTEAVAVSEPETASDRQGADGSSTGAGQSVESVSGEALESETRTGRMQTKDRQERRGRMTDGRVGRGAQMVQVRRWRTLG